MLPYVTRTESNNGIAKFTEKSNSKFGVDKGGCITIGLDTQTVFWQPMDFITGQNIHIVTSDRLNADIAFFVIPIIKAQLEKFNWGGNGATLGRLKRSKLILPANKKGQPDWSYMEAIGKKKRIEKLDALVDFLKIQQGRIKSCT